MSTEIEELPTFTVRAGARELVQVNFTPRLSSGDYLVATPNQPTIAAVRLRGYASAGTLTTNELALETGDTPQRLSFMVQALLPNVEYRLDCICYTQNMERKIIPIILKVRV